MGKNRSLTVLTSLVLIACFSMTASLYLGFKNFNTFLVSWGQDLQMTVYLKEDANDPQIQKLMSMIQQNKSVKSVEKVTSEENFNHFKNQMGTMFPHIQSSQEIKGLVPTTLQIVFNFTDSFEEPTKFFTKVADQIKGQESVEEVSYGQIWVEKFSRFFFMIRQAFWFLALVIILASIFVFSNGVRAWVQAKRFEIEVLELVGATPWTIRRPFVFQGFLMGVSTGALALIFVVILSGQLTQFMMNQDLMAGMAQNFQGFSVIEGLLFVMFSSALGLGAAYLCVREINSGWAASERT